MSEFSCRNNHLMSSRDLYCPICGEGCYYMDGLTSTQWAKKERWEEEQAEQEDADDDDDDDNIKTSVTPYLDKLYEALVGRGNGIL